MVNLNIKKFTEAAVLTGLFVILSVICISIGLGNFGYIDFIVPAFVGIIFLKCNLKYALMSCISSVFIIIFVIGSIPSGIMIIQSMILGIIIAFFIKRDESIFDDLFFSSIIACILMIFVDINFSVLTGYSFLQEAKGYLYFIPAEYDAYKGIIIYISISCLPFGTTLIGYILTLLFAKKLRIEEKMVLYKSNIIKNFRRYGQFMYCSKNVVYVEIGCILLVTLMNMFIFKDKYSYSVILLNSMMYISIFFVFQDSFSLMNKYVYEMTRSRGKLLVFQFLMLYFLVAAFKITFIIMIILSLYIDHKFNIKFKCRQILGSIN